ncbi:glycosyltransferase family 39 protein [Streptomyces sp. JJ38]|uniref:ArnT family glycosyltransferase n=1 Tax=Streptomyces sp. JJ38 TaxID=2738128 RepID=UPI001C57CFA3|nr:glycosyltransferase family 39 protein [Streptomyces sp. JJ38]MBW1598896.1 glycosyltransferase [Streptomyces sp. JJ38]
MPTAQPPGPPRSTRTVEPHGALRAPRPRQPEPDGPLAASRSAAQRPAPAPAVAPAPARAPERRFWLPLVPVLLVLAAVTRLPSFQRPVWNPDEGFVATQARMLAAGGTLYDTVVDRKPPLLPWLYQGTFALFGDESLWPLRVLAILAVVATAVCVAGLARGRWGPRAGGAAGVLCVLASVALNPEDTQAATFEVFMLPFTAAALWAADRRRWGLAGLAVAGAVLVKQTGGAVLLPVLYLAWSSADRGRDRRGAFVRTFGGLLVPLVTVALCNGVSRTVFWTVTGSGSYASFTGSELHVLGRGLANTGLFAVGAAGLVLPVAVVLRRRLSHRQVLTTDLWLWLAASAVGVLTGFHFFGHYYLQLVPPLAVLAAGALGLLTADWLRLTAVVSAMLCTVFVAWGSHAGRAEFDHVRRVADAVRARTVPQDEVLVWGMHPETYWMADRMPASRYLTAGLLTNYSGGRNGPRVGQEYGMRGSWPTLMRELNEDPPALIVDDSRGKPYEPARMPHLRQFLDAHYESVAEVDGAVFYRRAAPQR